MKHRAHLPQITDETAPERGTSYRISLSMQLLHFRYGETREPGEFDAPCDEVFRRQGVRRRAGAASLIRDAGADGHFKGAAVATAVGSSCPNRLGRERV